MVAWGPIIGGGLGVIGSLIGNKSSGQQTRTRMEPTPEARRIRDALNEFRFSEEEGMGLADRFGRKADYELGIGEGYIDVLSQLLGARGGAMGKVGGQEFRFTPKGTERDLDAALDLATKKYATESQFNPDMAYWDMMGYLDQLDQAALNREAGLAGSTGQLQGPSNLIPNLLLATKDVDWESLFNKPTDTSMTTMTDGTPFGWDPSRYSF